MCCMYMKAGEGHAHLRLVKGDIRNALVNVRTRSLDVFGTALLNAQLVGVLRQQAPSAGAAWQYAVWLVV